MALSLKKRIRRGYVIAFLLLLFSYLLIFLIISQLKRETNWVFHSYDVINTLHSLKAEITDAETGARGYIITKDTRFLQPYNASRGRVEPLVGQLRQLTSGNEIHGGSFQRKLDLLENLVHRRMKGLEAGLDSFQKNGLVISHKMEISRETNKEVMDSIRTLTRQLMDDEQGLWQIRNNSLRDFFVTTRVITSVSLVIAVFAAFYSIITFTRENRAKEKADAVAKTYRAELEETVRGLRDANRELEELKQMEKFASTGRIARTIAHEVRNPITNISLAAEQLKEMNAGYEGAVILIDMIGRNALRINQLVSDLLNSTRFTQLQYALVNINNLLDETLLLANDRVELNGVAVEKRYTTHIETVNVDKERMQFAFLNIMVNAIESMKKDAGVLKIETLQQGDSCMVTISDNGSGMDEETLRNLFEPYFTTKPKGNGLGMTNTQNIILNHGGKITVESKPGRGTTFTVTLKCNKPSPEL